ncbi:DUF4440 domain-containing protein [Streptomyces sp. BI20]|uniref:DUF4440 domain-containing protein n=1 Tax=Streptomyces sp. BI20 TaxID=3403460 RepID=UPI003C70DDAD
MTTAATAAATKAELDSLTAEFFGAFDNRGGRPARVSRISDLMLPGGIIVRTGPGFTAHTVAEFVEPRRELLASGRLVEFAEWETSEHTEVSGDVAARIGTYRKSGILDGVAFEGGGTKTFQFVRTPAGWRIAAFSWHDLD